MGKEPAKDAFDFAPVGDPERIGDSAEFKVTFVLTSAKPDATYTLLADGREVVFKDKKATVPMKAGERQVKVKGKSAGQESEKSHVFAISDKGFKIEDKGADVILKDPHSSTRKQDLPE